MSAHAYHPYLSFAVALGAGAVVGLQRERAALDDDTQPNLAGVRTHPIVALCGAVCALLAATWGAWIVFGGLGAVAALVVAGYGRGVDAGSGRGLTSEVAVLCSYLLGALALATDVVPAHADRLLLVVTLTVVVAALLSFKGQLRGFARALSHDDVLASVKFLVLVVLVLPWLPDKDLGPFGALNPAHIGRMVVLIAGLDFVGYVGVRLLGGERGIGLTALVGGLVSSTAVTLAMAHRAKASPGVAPLCALAVLIASTIMFVRVVAEVAVVEPALVWTVAPSLGAMALTSTVACVVLARRHRHRDVSGSAVDVDNPFELGSALKFGGLFAVVLLVSKAAEQTFGESGAYVAAFAAGLTDVDAITLSMARLAREGLAHPVAATAILIAAGVNTAVKAGMAWMIGGAAIGKPVTLVVVASLLAGGLGLTAVWL